MYTESEGCFSKIVGTAASFLIAFLVLLIAMYVARAGDEWVTQLLVEMGLFQ